MWSIIFIAHAVATTLVQLPEICLHDSTNTTPAPKNVKTKTLPTTSMKIQTIKLTLQNRVFSGGTAACLHQQVILNCSAMLHLELKCVYFHLRLVLYIFYCFRFYFLLMMDIAKSETLKNFSILNKTLLFLMKLNKTAAQSVPKI